MHRSSYTKPFHRPLSLTNRLISFETIMKEPLPPIDWLVKRLIPQETRTVVFGEFGSMKSWLLLHLGLHLAGGQPWLGEFLIPTPRSVLYVDEEMPQWELWRRIKRLGIGAGFDSQALPFRAVSQLGVRFREGYIEKLLRELKTEAFDPDVIIVETFRRVLEGNENEASDVAEFWHNVLPILTAGKTFIISHHMRKPSQMGWDDSRYRASGSTDILGGPDCAFAIKKTSEDSIEVECVKSRAAQGSAPFVVSIHDEEGEDKPVVMRYEGATVQGGKQLSKRDQASHLLDSFWAENTGKDEPTSKLLKYLNSHGISERTAERALADYKRQGKVEEVEHGVWRKAV